MTTTDPATAERARLLRNYGEESKYDSVAPWVEQPPRHAAGGDPAREAPAPRRVDRASPRARRPLRRGRSPGGRRHSRSAPERGTRTTSTSSGWHDRDGAGAAAERGHRHAVHYPRPVHEHPAYAELARADGRLATSERLAREVLSLPLYPELGRRGSGRSRRRGPARRLRGRGPARPRRPRRRNILRHDRAGADERPGADRARRRG